MNQQKNDIIILSVEVCYENKAGLGEVSRLQIRCIIALPLSRHVDTFCSLDKEKGRKAKFSVREILNVEYWYPRQKI